MSSSEEKKSRQTSNRAHALAAWEWFKEAAWLQVLLIVAVVVGLVVSIPFAVQGIVNALNSDDSAFFENHRIEYKTFQRYLDGEESGCNGMVGEFKDSYHVSTSKDGFVVMFYKSDCSDCDTMQKRIETWYNKFNADYTADAGLRLYTIDCSWDTDNEDDAKKNSGNLSLYDNKFITINEQYDVQQAIKDVYLDQEEDHKNSAVTEATLNTDIRTNTDASTIFTPLFVTYTKAKTESSYTMSQPTRVIFDNLSGLSVSSEKDMAKQMLDVFGFQNYHK